MRHPPKTKKNRNPDQNCLKFPPLPDPKCPPERQKKIGKLWATVRPRLSLRHLKPRLPEMKNYRPQLVKLPPLEVPYLQVGKKGRI